MRSPCVRLCVVSLTILAVAAVGYASDGSRPNIILIMADDMGWSDIGCYGGEVRTPNLDRLAAEGLRFSQFYNNAKCTTTRASLVTGLYPRKGGRGQQLLDEHMVTFGEVLREAGYQTALVGKWHLGSQPPHRPCDRGFDEYYGLMDGCCNFFNPAQPDPKFKGGRVRAFGHNDQRITEFPEDYYTTDAFTDHAIRTIKRYAGNRKPFFLHLTYTAPHYPLHARGEDIARYRGKYTMGWLAMRERRYRRQIEMGLIDPDRPEDLSAVGSGFPHVFLGGGRPGLGGHAHGGVRRDDRLHGSEHRSAYAAMIDSMDRNIGRLMQTLADLGIKDNTIVMFLSDNGGCAEEPGGSMTVGPSWGWAQNAPFKRYKANTHEGGVRTPLIVRWPGKVRPNTITHQPGHIIDFMATFVDLAGTRYPQTYKGNDIIPLEGKSLVPVFLGRKREPHDYLAWHWAGNRAVRVDDWKLVWDKQYKRWALYDLSKDQSETRDLSSAFPQRAEELANRWYLWARMTDVKYSGGR